MQDRAGNLWFGTTGDGVYRYNGKTFTNFTKNDGLSNNSVWCVYEDKNNKLWFGTDEGVCIYDSIASQISGPKTFSTLRITDNDPSAKNAVWSILQDKTGRFWFGTSNGVYLYDGKSFTNLLLMDGIINPGNLQLKHIQSIIEDKNGNILFASWNVEGVCSFDGKTLSSFNPNDDRMVHAILEDKKGNLWFGTRNNGACFYDGKTFTNFNDLEIFKSSCIYAMTDDDAGNIWFATEPGGVWCYKPSDSQIPSSKDFTNFTIKDGLIHNSVFSVITDKSGKLWFGTRDTGLCNFDGIKFTHFSD